MTTRQYFNISVNETKDVFIGTFKYMLSKASLVGTATMTTPPETSYLNLLDEGAKIQLVAGTNEIDYFFNGTTKYIDNSRKQLFIELEDNGVPFRELYKGNYQNKELESVIKQIAGQCGFAANTDALSEFVKIQKISRSPFVEQSVLETPPGDAQTGDSVSTVSGTFTPDCPQCRTRYTHRDYVTTVDNRCPKCGKYYSLLYQNNEFFCEACGAHFCGIDGFDKTVPPIYKLSIVFGPSPGAKFAEKPKFSSSAVSCEEELKRICTAHNLYLYKTPNNELIVREFVGFPSADHTITDNLFADDSYSKLKPTMTKLRGVDIAYNNGTVSEDIRHITDDPIKERIKLSRVDLDKLSAQNLAKNLLVQQMKDMHSDLEIKTLLNPNYVPGKWVKIEYFSLDYPFNIIDAYHVIERDLHTSTLRLKLYPEIFEDNNVYSNTYDNILTYELIKATAEKMSFGFVCNTGQCIGHKKIGDTIAMTDWLDDKIRRLGYRTRVVEYENPLMNSKISQYIQYFKNNQWIDFDYSNFEVGFQPSAYKTNIRVVSSN